jgi:hypothetical protein
MSELTIYTEFSTLRNQYLEVKQFIERETAEKGISLKTKLVDDLGLYGDDNYDLLDKFVRKYELKVGSFNYSEHFESESEIFNNGILFIRLLFFPFFFIIWLIRIILTRGRNWKSIEFYPDWNGPKKLDMTVADMIIWKLNNSYHLRANTKVIIK